MIALANNMEQFITDMGCKCTEKSKYSCDACEQIEDVINLGSERTLGYPEMEKLFSDTEAFEITCKIDGEIHDGHCSEVDLYPEEESSDYFMPKKEIHTNDKIIVPFLKHITTTTDPIVQRFYSSFKCFYNHFLIFRDNMQSRR